MKKNRFRLTESQLHRVIKESVKRVLSEGRLGRILKGEETPSQNPHPYTPYNPEAELRREFIFRKRRGLPTKDVENEYNLRYGRNIPFCYNDDVFDDDPHNRFMKYLRNKNQ